MDIYIIRNDFDFLKLSGSCVSELESLINRPRSGYDINAQGTTFKVEVTITAQGMILTATGLEKKSHGLFSA